VRRGELWTAAGGKYYAGKARPVLIVQDDRFDATASVTVCPLTTDPTDIPLLRVPLDPNNANGLTEPSRIMVDKVTTMPRSTTGEHIGRVSYAELVALSRCLIVFLGLAG
jgi:mRNA interferase MazF